MGETCERFRTWFERVLQRVCEFIKDVLETVDISRDVEETCERLRTWFEHTCVTQRVCEFIKDALQTVGHFERCGRDV